MQSQEKAPEMVSAILGTAQEVPLQVVGRATLWILVAFLTPFWLTILLAIGIVCGPYLKKHGGEVGWRLGWLTDAMLCVLAWIAIRNDFGGWFIATVVVGAAVAFTLRSTTFTGQMEPYAVLMVTGRVLMALGLFFGSYILIGYSLTEAMVFYGIIAVVVTAGWFLYKKGELMRDGR